MGVALDENFIITAFKPENFNASEPPPGLSKANRAD